jgi:hypothetical protein
MQGPRGEVTILDDPLNATILRACTLLASSGVGLFVVAPGFVLRPGPRTAFPALRRLDLTLEALVTLPRGAFVPDTGSGRFLVALTPGRPGVPVCGTLTADAAGMASLLDAVARGTAGRKARDEQAAASLSRGRS